MPAIRRGDGGAAARPRVPPAYGGATPGRCTIFDSLKNSYHIRYILFEYLYLIFIYNVVFQKLRRLSEIFYFKCDIFGEKISIIKIFRNLTKRFKNEVGHISFRVWDQTPFFFIFDTIIFYRVDYCFY